MKKEVMAENVVQGSSFFDKLYKYEVRMQIDGDDRIGVVTGMKSMLGNPQGVTTRVSAV